MNNTIKRAWNSNRLVSVEDLSGMTFQGEYGGHTFEVSGVDDSGSAVQLSGTVTAVFLRADNAAISISGSLSSGKAVVTLTSDCYTVPGRFLFTIFTTANSQKTAIYSATGNVVRTDGVATGSVPPLVTDSIQTGSITASGNSTLSGDVTIGGVLDVTPRRCFATLSSAGWYRVLRFDATNSFDVLGADGAIIDFYITRQYNNLDNDVHKITLLRTYNKNVFVGEESLTNIWGISKIRLTTHDGGSGDRQAFVDVYYATSTENPVSVYFNVYTLRSYADNWNAVNFTSVDPSPSGETVLTEYTFVANTGGKITFTPTSGSVYRACWYARVGNVCYLHIDMSGLTPNTNTSIFTLPVGFRPEYKTCLQGQGQESYGAMAYCTISDDGAVYVYSTDQYALVDGSFICIT